MLNGDEIKKVWDSITTISIDNVFDMIESGGVKPVAMNNGYVAALTMDILSEKNTMYHLSISNHNGKIDVHMANSMAQDILGDGYELLTIGQLSGCIQFIKMEKKDKKD